MVTHVYDTKSVIKEINNKQPDKKLCLQVKNKNNDPLGDMVYNYTNLYKNYLALGNIVKQLITSNNKLVDKVKLLEERIGLN